MQLILDLSKVTINSKFKVVILTQIIVASKSSKAKLADLWNKKPVIFPEVLSYSQVFTSEKVHSLETCRDVDPPVQEPVQRYNTKVKPTFSTKAANTSTKSKSVKVYHG